jgi:ribosomal protein L44E
VSMLDPQQKPGSEHPAPTPAGGTWRRWFFVFLCLGLVVIRLIKPDVAVDGTTLWLLGIAALAFTLPELVKFLAEFRRFEVGSVKFERYEKEIQHIREETEHEIKRIKRETEHEIERIKRETEHELRQIKYETEPKPRQEAVAKVQPPRRPSKNRLFRAINELRGKG